MEQCDLKSPCITRLNCPSFRRPLCFFPLPFTASGSTRGQLASHEVEVQGEDTQEPTDLLAVPEGLGVQHGGLGVSNHSSVMATAVLAAHGQTVHLRGRSADGSHGGGLLRVIRGLVHDDFNVIVPGKKGKRPSLSLLSSYSVLSLFCKYQGFSGEKGATML